MVPWYTVEPPTNGLCPKHCTCAVNLIDDDVQHCLEDYYDLHVSRITDQAERTQATKEELLHYASTAFWECKAEVLKIPPHLMDVTAPLPPCVSQIVERRVDGMLEDFDDLEEWFFAFKNAPAHEKQYLLDGYEDGSYSRTLQKRREDRATFLALNESYSVAAVAALPLPVFGPPSKKLKQTTLTQSEKSVIRPTTQVIDLTDSTKLPMVTDRKPKARVDHLTKPSYLSPPSTRNLEVNTSPACQSSFTTPPPNQTMH